MRTRRTWSVLVLGLVALLGAACVPLEHAPSGPGNATEQTFRYGPFTLGPGEEVMGSPSSGMPRPSGAFGLQSAKFDLVDANGSSISSEDVHLHHIVMTTSAHQDRLCPGRRERFIGSGMERTPITLWGPYTYLVGENDEWGSIYHLMNMTPAGTPAKTVYIEYTLGIQPNATAQNSRPVTPLFLDVTGCGGSEYDVPGNGGPGSVHTMSRSWTSPANGNGIAVFAGGHLHAGGIDITLKDETTGEVGCKSEAMYHMMHHLASINPCVMHDKITAGHTYSVTARYDNSMPVPGAMGIVLAYAWEGTQ